MSSIGVNTEAVEFEVKLTLKEFRAFQLQIIKRKPVINAVLIFSLILAANFIFGNITEVMEPVDYLPVFVFVFFCYVLIPFSFKRGIDKAFTSNKNLQEKAIYHITPEEISIEGETYENKFSISSLLTYKEFKNFFVLYQTKNQVYIIPKRVMSEEKVRQLRYLLLHTISAN
jgi:hypothetical protein